MIDDYNYGLNRGMVGIGANKSIARIDNVVVQVLPPEITLELAADFTDPESSSINLSSVIDNWQHR